jgi:predicted RNase H-like HicB family nuclease
MVCRKELALKLQRINKRSLSSEPDKLTIKRVVKLLQNAIEADNGKKLTYRRILYFRELLKLLEEYNGDIENPSIFTPLDELLIDHNFNSLQYISILTERMTEQIYNTEKQSAKLNLLLLFFKDFKQLHSNVKITFDVCHQNIKEVLENWFASEISFLQNRDELEESGNMFSKRNISSSSQITENKIQCTLSSDQMGLILRATDETRVLKAKSMSLIFKTIVPYLSTPFKRNLSYQSVRSKSYNPEEKDKEFVIKTLEKIIKHIKEY